ncbi:MAG: aminotransferase class I/II-fold pyridoxal phosphate-dependent enzyme [Spirochaetaceae bacterium]|jgi:threonine-phosphate decarboxylase|nr:aminotransferase class I/II-fold pyridoxal phosphate-dependent enzyme [Spirochaetaceae bacterium]
MFLTHGGDIYTALLAGKKPPLDFSTNINPLGMPRAAVRALKKNAARFAAYPDPLCRRLRAALSAHFDVPAEHIVCGAGAADLIYRLVQQHKPDTALVVQPSFAEYEKALAEAGAAIDRFYLQPPAFELDDAILPQITANTGMIFLCNPNNPTGKLIRPELVEAIAERCRETKTLLVMDECFLGLVTEGKAYSAVRLLDGHPSLVVLNAFTKTYALAGLRLGFAFFSDAAFAANVAAAGQSWPCSLAAEYAALAALDDTAYLKKSHTLIQQERRRLSDGLSSLGLEVIGGAANYLFLLCLLNKDIFFERLLERGILIRDCANYPSLEGGGYFRIAVKKPQENIALLAALRSIAEER